MTTGICAWVEYKRRHTQLKLSAKEAKRVAKDPAAATTAVLVSMPHDACCLSVPLLHAEACGADDCAGGRDSCSPRGACSPRGCGAGSDSDCEEAFYATNDSSSGAGSAAPSSALRRAQQEADPHHRWRVAAAAAAKFVLGTAVCLAFADPFVGAVGDLSGATGIPPFFVAFVATPLASNASELVSSLKFAAGRKSRNISTTFHQVGAVLCVNKCVCINGWAGRGVCGGEGAGGGQRRDVRGEAGV